VGKKRGIKVKVHSRVSKPELMDHACRAAGQILWSHFDNNPRAAYEGLYAGMPLFLSTKAGVPQPLLEQPFVTPVPWDSSLPDFNAQLGRFMQRVEIGMGSRKARREVVEWTLTALNPENVYWKLCQRIGLCAYRPEIQGTLDDESSASTSQKPVAVSAARKPAPRAHPNAIVRARWARRPDDDDDDAMHATHR